MGEKLILRYDEIGSFLFVEVCPPYAQQDSDEIGESVLGRFNLTTGELESVEVLFFDSWFARECEICLPVRAGLWPADFMPHNATEPRPADAAMTIRYDQDSDVLTLELRPPHSGQLGREICEEASARLKAATGEIESLEIRRFKARIERDGRIVLPIEASLRVAEPAQVPE